MKKILIIFIYVFFIKEVSAETIYGNYYKVDNINNYNNDEIKIDTYKIYNTYKIEYEDLGYMEENDDYIKDEKDFIYQKNLTENYKESDEYIVVNATTMNAKKVGITFGNISKSNFNEIEIFYKNEKIDYTINNLEDYEYFNLNVNNIKDNDIETYYTHSINHLSMGIGFQKVYDIEDISIIIHSKKGINNIFLIYIDNRPKIILNNEIDRKHIIKFKLNDNYEKEVEYFYDNEIKLYKYYKENKIKTNIYVKDGDNLILDDYKIINNYYTREKIILKENLVIEKKDQKISEFIEYSTGEVKQECNINYEINGYYKCKFILNDIEVLKDVFVNIKENETINEVENNDNLNYQKQYKKEVKEDYIESINASYNKSNAHQKIKKEKNKIKKSKKNNIKYVSSSNDSEEKIKNLNDRKQNNKIKTINKNKKYRILLIFIVIIIINVLIIIKKKKR